MANAVKIPHYEVYDSISRLRLCTVNVKTLDCYQCL